MSLSMPAVVPRAVEDDERCAASTTQREFSSSDMEIDDDDKEELQVSSKLNDASNITVSKGHGGRPGSGPLSAPQTSTRNLSPGAEFSNENKHPAPMCDFFARGWCVKGSSCRFIHVKDSGSYPKQLPEKYVAVEDEQIVVQLDEGIRNAAKRSRPLSPGSTDRFPSSVRNKTSLSPLVKSKDKSIATSLGSQQFSASTYNFEPSKDVRQNNGLGQSLPADNYVKPGLLSDIGIFGNNFLPKHIPSLCGSVTSLGDSYKENQKFRVSTWLASLPFSSSSACSHGAQKMLDNDSEYHTSSLSSFLQGSSPFSSFQMENFPACDFTGDPLHFASDDWEPSVPFRPSFFVTFDPSSPRGQHDPLRDSIDLSNVGGRPLKFSFCSQDPSLLNVEYPHTHDNFTSIRPLVPECNDDKRTASCHVNVQCGRLAKEEISSVASHVKDISKTSKSDTGRDARHRKDGFICQKDLKVDIVREKNEICIEHRTDGDALKESKAMRHFHTALVDVIKEHLKPTWREGHLSKDNHNIIVKKAVDKVIGTIQPHQIPPTFESIKEYFSLSQPKIARLVQAYIEKYGKS